MTSERSKRRKIAEVVSKLFQESSTLNIQNQDVYPYSSNMFFDSSYLHGIREQVDSNLEPNEFLTNSNYSDNSLAVMETEISEIENNKNTIELLTDDSNEWSPESFISDDYKSDESNDNEKLPHKLANWALSFNITHAALNSLLPLLREYGLSLPKDSRTLLHTPQNIDTKIVAGGEYYYFSMQYWLLIMFKNNSIESNNNQLTIHINIDGIPIFTSSSTSLWPILGTLIEAGAIVFPIAIYCGDKKPNSIHEYLEDFLVEIKALTENGFTHENVKYDVKLAAIICDAPARAFVKCIKGHNGYNCCERCVQKGEWCGKIILTHTSATLRTDSDFRYQNSLEHHIDVSPLIELGFDMVTKFPLDYMHLVCLGVVRRIINLCLNGPRSCKLSQNTVNILSDRFFQIRCYIPKEFSRKPRSLSDFRHWKATELRLFLIYTGPVVLKGLLEPKFYSNFLDLSVAIRILLCPILLKNYIGLARQLLTYFVQSFGKLYGKDQLVYNVHSLIHLADDAVNFGVLDKCSSFKYENYLGQLKKLVHRPQQPCSQIVRRIFEGCLKEDRHHIHQLKFSIQHVDGPITIALRHCLQFKNYQGFKCLVSATDGNNCFEVAKKIGLVRNIIQIKTGESCDGLVMFEEFAALESFFTDPLSSNNLSIFYASKMTGINKIYPLSDINIKYLQIPYKSGFIVMRQLHL
nr:uncharacterized protein LOC124810559 isoform X1 [Hydra vulgaris]